MSGTQAGAQKARDKNLQNDPNFYANIGSRSWNNPDRSRKTGFANLPREKVRELGAKGGSKTKEEYKIKGFAKIGDRFKVNGQEYEVALVEEWTTAEDIKALYEAEDNNGSTVS